MKKLILLALVCIVWACQSKKETETVSAVPVLTLKWKTDTLLTTVESVIYDEVNDVLYASNINGVPDAKDGNGFISKVSLDGKITEAKWVTGMDAPKGLGISNGKLYVTDIDRVHEIDIANGKILNSFAVEGAKFLNDITTSAYGKVYISDSGGGEVLVLENGKFSKWLTGQAGPNGLFAEANNVLVALWDAKTLNTAELGGQLVTVKTDSIENPDGIEATGDGGYLVSSWNGMIHYVDKDWKNTMVLDTRADSIGAADIEYIPAKHLLLVPTFFKNTVMAYEVK